MPKSLSEPVRAAPAAMPTAPPNPVSVRDRLTSKQYAALRSLSRTTGYDERGFKEQVRKHYGVEPAYLSRVQASELIGSLLAKTNGSGAREAG